MSLKAFHVVFITAATALAAGVAVWAFSQGQDSQTWLGMGATLTAAALPVYGWWFLNKMKDVSFL